MNNADMPAMPVRRSDGEPMNLRGEAAIMYSGDAMGLSKREMMVMHFGAALMSNPAWENMSANDVATFAIKQADAMLAALE